MVKTREPKTPVTPDPTALERFAAGAETKDQPTLNPNAPRDFKAVRLPFNQYEWTRLESACQKTGRSKLNFLRRAMLSLADAVENNER